MIKGLEHKKLECADPQCGDRLSCNICDLFTCRICGAAEGQLLSSCPGYRLNYSAQDACYQGNVIDFHYRTRLMKLRKKRNR